MGARVIRMYIGRDLTLYVSASGRLYRARIGRRSYYSVRKGLRLAGLEYVNARDFGDAE
jgi:hypothetical protein